MLHARRRELLVPHVFIETTFIIKLSHKITEVPV